MAYMPLNKAPQMLDDSTMPKIYDLSMPWGVDTPLWPFPAPARTWCSPVASTWAASTSAP